MKTKLITYSLGIALLALGANAQTSPDHHGWLNNETLKTPFGDFAFKNGYPASDSGQRLLDQLKLNRAITCRAGTTPFACIAHEKKSSMAIP